MFSRYLFAAIHAAGHASAGQVYVRCQRKLRNSRMSILQIDDAVLDELRDFAGGGRS
jgi:hypothetical protein